MIEGEKAEKRERETGRERERKNKKNVVEQLHFHFVFKCGDSGGPGGRQYIIS
jgi:hypothetical protein